MAGVGIVGDAASAEALQFSLLPGQAVATKTGSLWRWDGFVRHANQLDKSAERIRQRRRLEALQVDGAMAVRVFNQNCALASGNETALAKCRENMQNCRSASNDAEQRFRELRRRAESNALKLAAGQERARELKAHWRICTGKLSCEVEIANLADDAVLAAARLRHAPPLMNQELPSPRLYKRSHVFPICLAPQCSGSLFVPRKAVRGRSA